LGVRYIKEWKGISIAYPHAVDLLADIRKEVREAKANDRPPELRQWLPLEENPFTCEPLLDEWLADVDRQAEKREIAPGTALDYRSKIHSHVRPYFSDYDVRSIGYDAIKGWLDAMPGRVRSKQARRGVLQTFLLWCYRKGVIKKRPESPEIKGHDAKRKFVLQSDMKEVTAETFPSPYREIVYIAMWTAMRPGEILTLKVEDVEPRSINVRRTWSGGKVKEQPKGNRPRVIPLPTRLTPLMVKLCAGKSPTDWLFQGEDGQPLRYRLMKKAWEIYGPGIPFKDATRRTRATELRNAGMPLQDIQKVLGHASLNTTQIYLDGNAEYLTPAIDEIDERIEGRLRTVKTDQSLTREESSIDAGK
jgi:integrase